MPHRSENLQPSLFEAERPCVELRAAQKSELAIVIEVLLREIAAGGVAARAARGGATPAGGATAAFRARRASRVAASGPAKGAGPLMGPPRPPPAHPNSTLSARGHFPTQ